MSKLQINISKSVFNENYLDCINIMEPYQIFYGGAAAGKSYFVFQRAIIEVLSGQNKLVIRKYQNTLYDSCIALCLKIIGEWNLHQVFDLNKTERRLKCINGKEIIFRGLDDPEKVKSITVKNGLINEVICEEASELLEEDFNQLTLRLRGKDEQKKRFTLILNPISETHWIKKRFYDNPDKETRLIKKTYRDNLKYLAQDDIKRIEYYKINDPLYYQIYGLGEWGQLNYNDTIIGLEPILQMFENQFDPDGEIQVGADIARYGSDKTVIFKRKGLKVIDYQVYEKQNLVETAEKIMAMAENKYNLIKIDDTGLGGGVTDILQMQGYNVAPINFGESANEKDKYKNLISEVWFAVRENIANISCPEIKELKDELLSRKYRYDEKGRRAVESKDDFKKRYGKSPDYADAFLLCFYEPRNSESVFSISVINNNFKY